MEEERGRTAVCVERALVRLERRRCHAVTGRQAGISLATQDRWWQAGRRGQRCMSEYRLRANCRLAGKSGK